MLLAGLLFGAWPLLMNKGGLNGNVSSAILILISSIFILPIAVASIKPQTVTSYWVWVCLTLILATFFTILFVVIIMKTNTVENIKWKYVITAAVCSGIALLLFNDGVSQLNFFQLAPYFVIMIVMQAIVPAAVQLIINRQVSLLEFIGYSTALISVSILTYSANKMPVAG